MATARKRATTKKTGATGKSGEPRKTASRTSAATRAPPKRKWSQRVTETSDPLDLKEGVFSERDPQKIARSLKASAEHSDRRKSDPYRSAMSMLTFYINRAGKNLPTAQKRVLMRAKDELRKAFGRS